MTRRRTFYINKNTKRVRRGNDTTWVDKYNVPTISYKN
jgi:hypothetical protein